MEKAIAWTAEDMDVEVDPQQALDVAKVIAPLLASHHPSVIGGALADLTATWVLGFPAEVRETMHAQQVELIKSLVAVRKQDADEKRNRFERLHREGNNNKHN